MEKVLIIGVPRAGTTSVVRAFKYLDYLTVNEPLWIQSDRDHFEKGIQSIKHLLLKNRPQAVKFTTPQYPHYPKLNREERDRWWKELISLFDKTILLDRKDYEDHLISYCNLQQRYKANVDVRARYDVNTVEVDRSYEKWLNEDKKELQYISRITKLPIYYYEDIFYGDAKKVYKEWGYDISDAMADYLSPKHRYRTEGVVERTSLL